MRAIMIAVLVTGLTAAITAAASADEESPFTKECAAIADQKGLGAAARNRFVGECVLKRENSKEQVMITGKGGSDVSDADKKKLLYCGNVAATRKLSGESFNRHMRDCLSR